jgi:hypothetical protein
MLELLLVAVAVLLPFSYTCLAAFLLAQVMAHLSLSSVACFTGFCAVPVACLQALLVLDACLVLLGTINLCAVLCA